VCKVSRFGLAETADLFAGRLAVKMIALSLQHADGHRHPAHGA